jgi:hypothetical protein
MNNKGPIIRQAEALDENRIVLYKKSKQLGQGYYIVEISSNNTHLFIAAYDLESPESLLIELPEKRAQEILNEFMNDYESMASSLQVMNKRLVLLNPKFANNRNSRPQTQGGQPEQLEDQMQVLDDQEVYQDDGMDQPMQEENEGQEEVPEDQDDNEDAPGQDGEEEGL